MADPGPRMISTRSAILQAEAVGRAARRTGSRSWAARRAAPRSGRARRRGCPGWRRCARAARRPRRSPGTKRSRSMSCRACSRSMSSRRKTLTIEGVCSRVRADLVAVETVGLSRSSRENSSMSTGAGGAGPPAPGRAAASAERGRCQRTAGTQPAGLFYQPSHSDWRASLISSSNCSLPYCVHRVDAGDVGGPVIVGGEGDGRRSGRRSAGCGSSRRPPSGSCRSAPSCRRSSFSTPLRNTKNET